MNMIMRAIVASFALVLVGCVYTPTVESWCDRNYEYRVTQNGDKGFRLYLTVGQLISPNGCTNGLSRRLRANQLETYVKSLDEAHKIIKREIEGVPHLPLPSGHPMPKANHP